MSPARIVIPAHRGPSLVAGAAGGALGGALALAVLALGGVLAGRAPLVAPNVVGATLVRWLQIGQPQAFDNLYPDATLGGLLLAVLFGALVGAPLAAFIVRFPEDHPVAWGLLASAGLWALWRFALGPALNPVAARELGGWALAAAFLTYGLVFGAWMAALAPLLASAPPPSAHRAEESS